MLYTTEEYLHVKNSKIDTYIVCLSDTKKSWILRNVKDNVYIKVLGTDSKKIKSRMALLFAQSKMTDIIVPDNMEKQKLIPYSFRSDNLPMPIGKYKGLDFSTLPERYQRWVHADICNRKVRLHLTTDLFNILKYCKDKLNLLAYNNYNIHGLDLKTTQIESDNMEYLNYMTYLLLVQYAINLKRPTATGRFMRSVSMSYTSSIVKCRYNIHSHCTGIEVLSSRGAEVLSDIIIDIIPNARELLEPGSSKDGIFNRVRQDSVLFKRIDKLLFKINRTSLLDAV